MPLNAESKMTSEAVITAIPITEIRVIQLIRVRFLLVERYRRAM